MNPGVETTDKVHDLGISSLAVGGDSDGLAAHSLVVLLQESQLEVPLP